RGERSRAALDGDLLVQDGRRAPAPSPCIFALLAPERGASSGCHSARRAGGGAGPPRARADGRREEAGAPESAAGPRTAPLRGSACGTRGCSGP
ncbi:unnamed protein product, partial [Prorocentrum cordatum]